MIAILVRAWPKLSETFVAGEVLGLERAGLDLVLYALDAPGDEPPGEDAQAVRASVHHVPPAARRTELAIGAADFVRTQPAPLIAGARAFAEAHHGEHAEAVLARALWLAARLVADGVRHLHVHWASEPADVAELASRLTGIPFSISAHAKDIWLSAPAALARKLGHAAFTVTCTEYNRRFLSGLAEGNRVHRMYHGIDTARFRPAESIDEDGVDAPPLVLSVGRLREKKGFPTLLEACARLVRAGRRLRCVIVGYGPERVALEARIVALGLTDVVTLAGRQPQATVIAHYRRAAVFVLPCQVAADGDRDGIPNVLLEAMACGVPVVTTDVSGIPEAVTDGANGRIVPPGDAAALADAIGALLDDRPAARALGINGRDVVTTDFDGDANLAVLRSLIERTHRVASARPHRSARPAGDGNASSSRTPRPARAGETSHG
jgi:glycosyltransferase involved in cell wall biosynthesis